MLIKTVCYNIPLYKRHTVYLTLLYSWALTLLCVSTVIVLVTQELFQWPPRVCAHSHTLHPCANQLAVTRPCKQHVWQIKNRKPLSSSLTQLLAYCFMTCFLLTVPASVYDRKNNNLLFLGRSRGGALFRQERRHLKIRARAGRAGRASAWLNNPKSSCLNNGRKQLGNTEERHYITPDLFKYDWAGMGISRKITVWYMLGTDHSSN